MTIHTSLDKVAKIFNGKTPSKTEQRDAGHPVLKIKDVSESGEFSGQFESFVDHNMAEKFSQKFIQEGDVLILNAAHNADYVGSKVYQADRSVSGALPTGEWLIIRANKREIDPDYLFFWVFSADTKFKIRNLVKGIHLYPRDVATIKLDLPPLTEQRRIAAILDKADAIRRKRQLAIELTENFLRSAFLEMFGDPVTNPNGWEIKTIGEMASIIVPTRDKPKSFSGNIPWITLPDVKGFLVSDAANYLTIQEAQEVKNRLIPKDAILLSCAGSLGVVALTSREVFANQQFYGLVPFNDKINFVYLMLALRFLPKDFYISIAGTATISFFSKNKALSIELPVPPLDIQARINQVFYKFISNRNTLQKSTQVMDKLFNSLTYRAFRGELATSAAEEILKEAAIG